jgi:AP-3 complex subunit delta-1
MLTSSLSRSDLDDPRPVIASLFGSSTTSSLPPRILALDVHNGVKIYASWLSALAAAWDESSIEQIRSITTALENQLAECAKSQDIELQERAAELHGLLQLVRTGLDAPRPVVESLAAEQPSDDASGGFASSSRAPPSSLTLLDPLFFSHELNPVNPKAQGLVTAPGGLDLDVAINPSAWAAEGGGQADEQEVEVDEFGRPLRVAAATSEEADRGAKKKKNGKGVSGKKGKRRGVEKDPEELAQVRTSRLLCEPSF